MLRGDDRPEGTAKRGNTHASRALRLIAVAALVAVAAIGVGSASRPHSVEFSWSAPQLGGLAALALLVLGGAFGLVIGSELSLFWARRLDGGISGEARKSRLPWGVRAVLMLVPLMVLAFAIASARSTSDSDRPQRDISGTRPAVTANTAAGGDASLIIASLAVAVVGGLVAAVLFGRDRPAAVSEARSSRNELTAILDEGLGPLLTEHDPRKAVIAAYVAMERAMARRGWARRPHEAPTEYLARVLGVAPSRAQDLQELVSLYQFARFSEHTVTPAMRDAAVDSVRRVRAELREPA